MAGRPYSPPVNAGVLIGDEPGLGKTIQAIGVFNADPTIVNVLIVVPASLKLNWRKEWERWACRKSLIGIAQGSFFPPDGVQVCIVNYEIVAKNRRAIDARVWDMLIVDESHRTKNPKAQQTRAIVGGKEVKDKKGSVKEPAISAIRARRRIWLTGTPILNRPEELWTTVATLDPNGLGKSWFAYHTRYCDAHKDRFGWQTGGASNLPELQEKLRSSIMIRRLKSEVLTDLPPKRRQVIELAADDAGGIVKRERETFESMEDRIAIAQAALALAQADDDENAFKAAVLELTAARKVVFEGMSKLRKDTAIAKVPAVIEHLHECIEASGKVVCFIHHIDVGRALAKEFGTSAVMLIGETPAADRQAAVDRFQTDPTCTLFVGGIIPAGVGITLTASSHVVMAEIDWRPGIVTQAEDRCHRIGQRDSVLVQHLVFDGSLDAVMAKRIVQKQGLIDQAMDDRTPVPADADTDMLETVAEAMTVDGPAAPVSPPRQREQPDIPVLTTEQIQAVQAGLRMLAAMDGDGARVLNGMGFSKVDTSIGHSLAERHTLSPKQAALAYKIVRKYSRQLPEDLRSALKA